MPVIGGHMKIVGYPRLSGPRAPLLVLNSLGFSPSFQRRPELDFLRPQFGPFRGHRGVPHEVVEKLHDTGKTFDNYDVYAVRYRIRQFQVQDRLAGLEAQARGTVWSGA